MIVMLVWRWIFVMLAVVGSFAVAVVFGGVASHYAALWEEPVAGFISALTVIIVAYFLAPSHKLRFASIVYALGAMSAWSLLEPSWWPESYGDRAYQTTHLPILCTCTGGLLGLLLVMGHRLKFGPKHSFRPKRFAVWFASSR